MKKYIFYNAFVLVFLVYYLFSSGFIDKVFVKENSPVNPAMQSGTGSKEFINFIYNMGYFGRWGTYNPNYTKSIENQIYRYNNELHFTGLQVYSGANSMNDGESPGGGYYDLVSSYTPYFDSLITLVNNNNLKGFYGRAKFELLSYAQRLEYEVKSSGGNPSDVNYGFCYNYTMPGMTCTSDSGRTVLHAQVGVNQPGYLCKNIFENLQHSDLFSWQHNDSIEWRIRPMLRIDSNYVDNFPDSPVVRIDIIKFNGNLKKSVVIKARNFAKHILIPDTYIYNGRYIDSIDFFDEPPETNLLFWGGKDTSGLNDGWYWDAKEWDDLNNVDFRVYWYGNTDVWFDKLTVEDKWAEKLFSGSEDNIITEEINAFKSKGKFAYFVDELTYSNLLCTKYVKTKIKDLDKDVKFISAISNYTNWTNLRNDTIYFKALVEILQPEYLSMDAHEVTDKVPQIYNNTPHLSKWNSNSYNEYNDFVQYKLLGDRHSVTSQSNWNENNYSMPRPTGSLVYQVCLAKRYADMCYPKCYLFAQPQLQMDFWICKDENDNRGNREPTNEEIRAQANVSLAHGADGLCWFTYQSFDYNYNNLYSDYGYYKGVLSPDGIEKTYLYIGMLNLNDSTKRTSNYYGQNKWDSVAKMNEVFLKWKPVLDNSNWLAGYSVHSEGANHNFITDIRSKISDGNSQNACQYDTPGLYDCPYDRFWEMGFFEPISNSIDKSKYVLTVNRRCNPKPQSGESPDRRTLYVNFKMSEFQEFPNWNVIDVYTKKTVANFTSNDNYTYINLGLFEPGEGKLLRVVPVSQSGGIYTCDETISGGTITCEDTIYTNGHNLTIGFGTTINFTDSACIVVNGGSFTCGDVAQPTHERNIIFKGVTGNTWSGFIFNNCDLVNINSAQFQNVKGPAENTNYAVKLINCNSFNINNCTFTNSDPQKCGAIEANYTGTNANETNVNIAGNTFNMNTSDKTIVSVIANAESIIPVMLDNNIFTSTSNSATAVYLAFVSGVEIGGNAIVGYNKGIEMHYTNIDVIGNSITSTTGNNGAKDIDAEDFSTANLTSTGTLRTGGLNIFDNAGQNINNIYVNDSYFYLDKGKNIFSILSNSNSYHLKGYFPGDTEGNPVDETSNCFKVDNVAVIESNLPVKDVKWMESENDIDFYFFSYDCSTGSECDEMIVDMGNSVYDTICIIPGGSGGGVPSVQTVTPKKMYDSLCVLMRLRNFSLAKTKCYQLLTAFPDSSLSLNAVSKLYYLAVARDTSTANITECKTFLNTLILNHQNNLPLVRKCNYYVQKCKVKLKQYQSAMTGFQQIMQQNPYSYEALLASWDYAATHLLDSLNGPGGVSSNVKLQMLNVKLEEQEAENSRFNIEEFSSEDILSIDYDALFEKIDNLLFNDDDKDAFTKEQRKSISTSVVTALDESKKKSKNHIETLTKKSEEGNTDAKVELKVIKTLKEVVKIKKPKTIFEHIKSVNKDIQKLNTVKNETTKNVTNIIPDSYNLSQNYPNPFNPVTKINYELPKDGRVKLVIYDILGREIKTLVNELKQAGRYTVEFNGNSYASGVYFFRIQVEGGKSYTAVKKMVLIK